MQTLTIEVHPSVGEQELRAKAIASLRAGRIDPTFLYVTPRQAELWRQVFLRHSPLHANPGFARVYRDAFARALERFSPAKVLLVGLGCGTGQKELEFFSRLKTRGCEALFSAIDVSRDLVSESAHKLAAAGAGPARSLVCDLAQPAALGAWLAHVEPELPRLLTFFGLVPNFAPTVVTSIFRAVLRPGDLLLVSAHLVPVPTDHPDEMVAAMESVLPQYDNPETLAWLAAALEPWGLENLVGPPEMKIAEMEETPAFIAFARWKTGEPFKKWGHCFSPKTGEPLQLFSSLRHTPGLFENRLRAAGFEVELLAITTCRQEAVWAVHTR